MSQFNGRLPLVIAVCLVAGCGVETVTPADPAGPPSFARGGGQTLHAFTFQGGVESDLAHPFSAMARANDPFGGSINGSPVYLLLPAAAGGVTSVCDQDGSGQGGTTPSWAGYAGVWKGEFSTSVKGGKYHVSYRATREDGSGMLWLVINGPGIKSNANLTLTFTNARGLVSLYSTPDGGAADPQDRCLTFSITASP